MNNKLKKLLKSFGFSLLSIVYLIVLSLVYPFLLNLVSLPSVLKGILFYFLLVAGFMILFKIAQNNKYEQ